MFARAHFALVGPLLLGASSLHAQAIIAQSSGLANPDQVIDFGAGVLPNWTPVTNQFSGITVSHAAYYTTGAFNNLVGGFLTNDFSGPPNTLRIQFTSPISALSFVYHQINPSSPSHFRVLLGGVLVDSFSNTSDQFQTNNYFGFTNLVFDELQLDFVGDFNVDTLALKLAGPSITSFCTSSTTTNGCSPAMSGSGTPSASASSGFTLSASAVEGQRAGLVFYGVDNSNWTPLPWLTGSTSFLCVKPPTQRTTAQSSGGTAGACDGALSIDWSAFVASNPGSLGAPFQAGDRVFAQGWFRDPGAPKTTNLSNGLEFVVAP